MKRRIGKIGCLLGVWLLLAGCGGAQEALAQSQEITETAETGETAVAAKTAAAAELAAAAAGESGNLSETEGVSEEEEETGMKMNVEVNGTVFTAALENNGAADALAEMMKDQPVTIQMRDYAGFEKVGPLGQNLPASDSRTTTQAGDIVLYQGNQIVIFYGSNTWSYTRLGKIEDLSGWEEALGRGDAAVTFSLESR